ncbi:MFS transporter [Anaerosporomusa subterranea]|uniref:MFS transporter n=1 Tax=Anaerosporomusa subterranea TaxID=1794912 RepID=A0A154BNN0_ANASB|nr:pyridoxamine 5'-phosphate oxidase family protein [Anaerosporomusa subterranea]KYZ75485.1 MFS transporter [Anaerosporomusa subterranea]
MFKEMRRHDRGLTRSETDEILLNGVYGVLSINGEDDYAYGVPLSYVYTGGHIYFHCAQEGYKLNCTRKRNKVTFCVVGKANTLPDKFSMEYASAIVFGEVSEVHDQEKLAALMAFVEKYSSSYMEKGKEYADSVHHKTVVLKIDSKHITGKARK